MWPEPHRGAWRIRDRVGTSKVTLAAGFPSKTAALTAMTLLKADRLRGEQLVAGGDRMTLGAWIDEWWPDYVVTLRGSSRVSAEGIISRYIRPMLGHVPLGELDHRTVQRWTADLLAGRTLVPQPRPLAGKTVRNAHGLLHRILGAAVAQRLVRANVCVETTLPQKTHHEMRFLTEPEADRLMAAMREMAPHYLRMIAVILATGMRWGEAVGLRVRHVDVLARRITILKATSELADTAELVDEEPKTAAGRRTVTVTPDIAALLAPLVAYRDRDARVFTAPMGGTVRQRVFYARWMRVRAAAGLGDLRVHDLRHTHAAWLISGGVPLTAVQRRLGHASITVTSDLYGHLMPEVDDQILAVLSRAMPDCEPDGGGPQGGNQPDPTRINSPGLVPTSRSAAGAGR